MKIIKGLDAFLSFKDNKKINFLTGLEASNYNEFYLFSMDGKPVGRCGIGFNSIDNKNVGLIGPIEFINDYLVVKKILDFAISRIKELSDSKTLGINEILFPFYRSTWHYYRLSLPWVPNTNERADQFTFNLDQVDEEFSHSLIKQYLDDGALPGQVFYYASSKFNDLHLLLEKEKNNYYKAVNKCNISFKNAHQVTSDRMKLMEMLYLLSIQGFSSNQFYSKISLQEFTELYYPVKDIVDTNFITLAYGDDDLIGFLFSLPEDSSGLILKSATVLPSYQNKGIYGGMLYLQLKMAIQKNFKYVVAAFYSCGNYSEKFLQISENKDKTGSFLEHTASQVNPIRENKYYELFKIKLC